MIMQVAEEHYSSDYRCTISIDSLQEGQQEKEGMFRNLCQSQLYVEPSGETIFSPFVI